MVHTD